MKINFKQKLLSRFLVAAVLVVALLPGYALAASGSTSNITGGVNCGSTALQLNNSTQTGCDTTGGVTTLNSTITNVINTFSLVVGIVAVVMLIYGGFRYVTSGGDSGNIGNAKNTIMYAIVGLVIVAVSQAVVQFVLTKA